VQIYRKMAFVRQMSLTNSMLSAQSVLLAMKLFINAFTNSRRLWNGHQMRLIVLLDFCNKYWLVSRKLHSAYIIGGKESEHPQSSLLLKVEISLGTHSLIATFSLHSDGCRKSYTS